MKKKNKKRRCRCREGCSKMFGNKGARGVHEEKIHLTPERERKRWLRESKKHVPFIELGRNLTWGKQQPKGEWKDPSDNDLIIGILFAILEKLKRARTIR